MAKKEKFYLIHYSNSEERLVVREFDLPEDMKKQIIEDLEEDKNYCFANGADILIRGERLKVDITRLIKVGKYPKQDD